MEQPGDSVNYVDIFQEDHDGNQGEFAECLRGQDISETLELYAIIQVFILCWFVCLCACLYSMTV